MSDKSATGTGRVETAMGSAGAEWKGYTLEELKMRRAVALVKREMGRAQFAAKSGQLKTTVQDNGIRGLLFSKDTVTKLKTADYVLLGWRLISRIVKYRNRRRR